MIGVREGERKDFSSLLCFKDNFSIVLFALSDLSLYLLSNFSIALKV